MALRRIMQHVKEQNWFAVWLDIVIVFLGVFIGLQADNWNDARNARDEARKYYARLAEDLRAEESTRLALIAYYQRVKQHGEAALAALHQPDKSSGEEFLVNLYQATQVRYYVTQRSTYDELLSGGIAHAIPDPDVRTRLANYYVALGVSEMALMERTPFRSSLRSYMPHTVQSSVRENCGDRYTRQENNLVISTLTGTCDLALDTKAVSEALVALSKYSNLEIDLNRHLADVELKLLTSELHLAPTRELAERLERKGQ